MLKTGSRSIGRGLVGGGGNAITRLSVAHVLNSRRYFNSDCLRCSDIKLYAKICCNAILNVQCSTVPPPGAVGKATFPDCGKGGVEGVVRHETSDSLSSVMSCA